MSGGNKKSQHVWLKIVLARNHGANLHVGRNRMRSGQMDLTGSKRDVIQWTALNTVIN